MAKIINEPSHTFNEYLLIPGYSSAECIPANVSLKTPLVKYNKKAGEKPAIEMNIPMVSAIMQSVSGDRLAVALAIVEKNSHPMLNMEMQLFLEKQTSCRMMCSTGLNPNTSARIYPLFRYHVDKLKQYYKLGEINDFRIAKVIQRPETAAEGETSLCCAIPDPETLLTMFNLEAWKGQMPYKDMSYLRYRYFEHPFYHYEMFGICQDVKSAEAVLVGREISLQNSKVFRIVDYLGNRKAICGAGLSLTELMKNRDWEYIDFYCYGMNDEDMRGAGFVLRDENDPNIIPNYFEPFVQKNVDIWFFCKQHEQYLICKADGDQDRPNIY